MDPCGSGAFFRSRLVKSGTGGYGFLPIPTAPENFRTSEQPGLKGVTSVERLVIHVPVRAPKPGVVFSLLKSSVPMCLVIDPVLTWKSKYSWQAFCASIAAVAWVREY
jgi:hypothetical protein